MWFDDEVISGRELGSVRRHGGAAKTLRVMRRGENKGGGAPAAGGRLPGWVVAVVAAPIAVAALAGACWYGSRALNAWMFSRNERFTITRLQIRCDNPIVADFIREQKGIREGTNLFGFDPDALREEFLRRAPAYRAMRVTRMLPDVLLVDVTPRVPLARLVLGWRDTLVTDRDGIAFAAPGASKHLPAISGCADRDLEPGLAVRGVAVAAVQLVDVCDNPQLGIQVQQVEVSNPEQVTVTARYGAGLRRIRLTWDGMGSRSPESRMSLLRKLGRWVQVMQNPQGIDHQEFDGTYPDRIYAL